MTASSADPDPLPVRRCVCFGVTFAELKAEGIQSLTEATQRFGCGSNCGLCRPYIHRMIQTGETAFRVLAPEEDDPTP